MGGQLGSSSTCSLALYSSTAKIPFPKICGFWGFRAGAKIRGAPALQTRFKRNCHVCIEMVSIKTCFPRVRAVLKSSSAKNFKLLRQKTSKQKRFTSRKLQERKVNLNPQNSWPQKTFWVRGRKSRTRNWNLEPEPQRKTQTQHAPGILMPMCCASSGARLKEATTLRDSRRSTGTETISSGYRKHDAVC